MKNQKRHAKKGWNSSKFIPKNCPTGKVSYRSVDHAWQEIKRMQAHLVYEEIDITSCKAYRCWICCQVHMTSKR